MLRLAAAAMVMVGLGANEVLQGIEFRAVTLEPGQRKTFRVPGLERVGGNSGTCIEEGLDLEEPETFWLRATCGGVRTATVWRADLKAIHVLACGEDASNRPAGMVKLRQKVQAELKSKQQTACVRNGHVELWGWAKTAEEKKGLDALAAKYGDANVRNLVETLEPEGE